MAGATARRAVGPLSRAQEPVPLETNDALTLTVRLIRGRMALTSQAATPTQVTTQEASDGRTRALRAAGPLPLDRAMGSVLATPVPSPGLTPGRLPGRTPARL